MHADPNTSKATVVVWGLLAAMPFGGMIWQVLHHLEGFRRLGFDVWYVEDSLIPCMHPDTWQRVGRYDDTLRFLNETMRTFGFQDRWVFRPPGFHDECVGARDSKGLADLYNEADVVFNLCGANRVRPELTTIDNLVMLQTDPVGPQVANAKGNQRSIDYHNRHHHHFTYAENIGKPACSIPHDGIGWIPTRPPIVTDWWTATEAPSQPARLTTIANWDTPGRDYEWRGQNLRWIKSAAFEELVALPSTSSVPLELALSRFSDEKKEIFEQHGWIIRDAKSLSDRSLYRDYIRASLGEFTASKENVVRTWSGWFSDRSACYLAAGRPVITQDTGFGDVLPVGLGLLSFTDFDEAAQAIEEVAGDYDKHAAASLEIAREYFEAEIVLGNIMRHLGLM